MIQVLIGIVLLTFTIVVLGFIAIAKGCRTLLTGIINFATILVDAAREKVNNLDFRVKK